MLSIAGITAAAAVPAGAEINTTPSVSVSDRTPAPGQRVVVSGKARSSYGQPLELQFRPDGASAFTKIAQTKVGHGDRFRVAGEVPSAGTLRVSVTPNGASAPVLSHEVGVELGKTLKVGGRRLHVRSGQPARVKGRATPGDTVRFQAARNGKWTTLGKTRARSSGRFVVRGRSGQAMSAPARIVTGGHRRNIGRLNVYRFAEASWYGPGLYGGHLACGGTLNAGTIGVANKSLPCGTKVTLRHGGKTVRVPVVDRGPYVGNREYDLTAATAQKLGFSGTGAILATR